MKLMGLTFHCDIVMPISGYKAYNAWIRVIIKHVNDEPGCGRLLALSNGMPDLLQLRFWLRHSSSGQSMKCNTVSEHPRMSSLYKIHLSWPISKVLRPPNFSPVAVSP